MAVKIAPTARRQYIDSNGNPYSGAKLFYYAAGTTTKQTTYTTSVGNTANTNPIVLDSSGRTPYGVWFTSGLVYKEVLASSTDTDPPTSAIFTEDNITGVNDQSATIDQWISSAAPTYVSATSFTLVGDQTALFTVGRRIKTTNTAGTIYSTIVTSVYTTLTTVTVVNDSGVLDSGLVATSYGLLTPDNISVPLFTDALPIVSGSADKTKKLRFEVDGLTTATTRVVTWLDKDITPAGLDANTFTGVQTLNGVSVIHANASVAAHATTANIWSLGNYVTLTGTAVTFTNLAAAPQAGAEVELYMNAAHTFTDGAVFEVDGNASYTATIGDRVRIRAKSTTVFTVCPIKSDGTAVKQPATQAFIDANTTYLSYVFNGGL